MAKPAYPRIICLSNVFDQHYHDLRGEKIARCLSAPKRQGLFQCLQAASGREVVLLSSPPRASERRVGKWLPPMETKFSIHRQFFCANWDAPKLRVPLSWIFYARHVLRHVRSGDLVVIDNYEFIYVFAAWFLKLFRRVAFILDYEDGKHLIERSWGRILSGLAEAAGRPLLSGALLAHPALGKRLPASLPTLLVPGFVPEQIPQGLRPPATEARFLYSGTLDHPRGVDLLLESLPFLPEKGWHLLIAGQGALAEQVARFTQDPRWRGRVEHQYPSSAEVFNQWLSSSCVGLNCQRASDPVSGVTFPSKVFTYLSAGLVVISSKASEVETICGQACLYYHEETPSSLAAAMREIITDFAAACRKLDRSAVTEHYSAMATTARLRKFLRSVGLPE